MRASLTLVVSGSVSIAIASLAVIVPARADPAYTADKIIPMFAKEKAAVDAYKTSKTRAICVGTAADCPAAKPPTVTQFDLLVKFEFNSDKLTQPAKDNLDQFAKALEDPQLQGQKFEIDGHTDATGPEDYNRDLSERRANAVVSYLTSKGLDPSALTSKGLGKSSPRVADPYSPENRRVETHLVE
jgi:outer membrane protein OmpA-like peptidoglycan-associated protein